jgi:hypothetical protein
MLFLFYKDIKIIFILKNIITKVEHINWINVYCDSETSGQIYENIYINFTTKNKLTTNIYHKQHVERMIK